MNRPKSVLGLGALLALALCAFAAASAPAAQRAWTCAPGGSGYSDAHCVTNSGSGFSAVEIANGTATEFTVTNEKTASGTTASSIFKLHGTLSGISVEIQCTSVHGEGSLTNSASSVSGTAPLKITGCKVTLPAGRGCLVQKGEEKEKFTTNLLKESTAGQEANAIKVEPNSGAELATVPIEGCLNNKPPKADYPLSGSVVGTTSGATFNWTAAATTAQGTLTWGGNPAGIEVSLTPSMKLGNPIFLK